MGSVSGKCFPLESTVFMRKGNELCDMGVLETGECNVISIINNAKEFLSEGIQTLEKWELCIVFPWYGLEHTLVFDLELMYAFEEFDRRNKPIIYFHINAVPLLEYTPNTSPQEIIIQANTNPQTCSATNSISCPFSISISKIEF
ncbi:hypothetical protein Dsin_020996 [Dipteronia sinensis]|uniref:Uncharacterized protein n=1 Tax=Dipteronia sinensis TaxID=43782 RepID=A0AAE0E464_9ROSI|nr:hypothetical protein Dsin_020996 [Dipteronia sinensis]